VFKVDNRAVVLVAGQTPPYRVLAPGARGPDVRQFERNLWSFGHRGFTVDDVYSPATAAVVRGWQRDHGWPPTGQVDVNQIVVAPGAIRVAEHKAAVGADATGEVLTYTGTTRVVAIDLSVTRQQLVHQGQAVTVTLPDGATAAATVSSIARVASAAREGSDSGPTVAVTVTITEQRDLGNVDGASVGITLVVDERADVLTVPVAALVALAEGGYGVQVVVGSSTRYLPVATGMFAGGRVEVSGEGVVEGLTVGVPS
jgi:peptidoglycan hydrolase-like protein with peptidoglycan-binding domain